MNLLSKLVVALTLAICILFLPGCKKDITETIDPLDIELEDALVAAGGSLSNFILPESDDFGSIPQDPLNPLTPEKVELGKFLFHEPGLASNPRLPMGKNVYSCASCHHAGAGFQAGRRQGLAEGGLGFGINGEGRDLDPAYPTAFIDVQPIRTPSAMHAAYQINQLWNGQFGATGVNIGTESFWTVETPKETNHLGYQGTEIQAIAGLGVHELEMDSAFCVNTSYETLFNNAYPGLPVSEQITAENAGLAIAAYERTLLANKAPFQKWLRGDQAAMTESQKKGAVLFFSTANCVSCHNGPALNDMNFYALGMEDLNGSGVYGSEPATGATNRGRGGFTNDPADDYKFKTPQLYNLKDSPFYGHGGTFTSVKDVIEYKNAALPDNTNVPPENLAVDFIPLNLSVSEIQQITDFIENGLHDPDLMRYVPESLPSGFCFPNNDEASKADLGCN
ncbi:MAG: cytochrome c peroxidase [Bacteroidota bacterium]